MRVVDIETAFKLSSAFLRLEDLRSLRSVSKTVLKALSERVIILIEPAALHNVDRDVISTILDSVHSKSEIYGWSFRKCIRINMKSIGDLMEDIKYLDLSNSICITNEDIFSLPRNLIRLNLSLCKQITDEGLLNLPITLQILTLCANPNIRGSCFYKLPPSLRVIDLLDCNNVVEEHMYQLPKHMESIDISHTIFTSDCTSFLSEFKYLKRLVMRYCENTSEEPFSLLPETLEEVCLRGCVSYAPNTLKRFGHLHRLRYFVIAECAFTDFTDLKSFTRLKTLDVAQTLFSDKDMAHLSHSIEDLDLSYCENITDEALYHLPKSLRLLNLQSLRISQKGLSQIHPSVKFDYILR